MPTALRAQGQRSGPTAPQTKAAMSVVKRRAAQPQGALNAKRRQANGVTPHPGGKPGGDKGGGVL